MKPGDKVICVDDNNLYHIPVRCICSGLIYTLTEVFECSCGNVYVRLAEVDKYYKMWCPKCDLFSYTKMFFHIERFRLLDQAEKTANLKNKVEEHIKTSILNPN